MAEKFYYLGVDPGSHGAFALLSTKYDPSYIEDDDLILIPFPASAKDGLNVHAMWSFLQKYETHIVLSVLEHVHSLGLSSAKSTFGFGFNTGIAYALLKLINAPIVEVAPTVWQKNVWRPEHMVYLDAAQKKRDPKAISLNASKDIYPGVSFIQKRGRVPHDGCVDAALIAWYAFLLDRELTVQPKRRARKKKASSRRSKS